MAQTNKKTLLDEKNHVEEPFMKQLENLEWDNLIRKEVIGEYRTSVKEVILDVSMRKQLKVINPWLDEEGIEKCIRDITTGFEPSLINTNEKILDLIRNGTVASDKAIPGNPQNRTAKFIDFDEPKNNDFTAISQFNLHIPGRDKLKFPDIVLFVNGLPLVVVECKSDKIPDPMGDAIDQINMYANQGEYEGTGSGNQKLFYYNQFTVATCQRLAKFGTITTLTPKYYFSWTDPYPYQLDDIKDKISAQAAPSEQERLIYGMLSKDNLLSLVKSFTIFIDIKKKKRTQKVKIVARYQQFRAVKKEIERLRNNTDPFLRGGIIWHTQGSGKSFTMMFMVREMWRYKDLQNFKIVFINDRTDLEKQLTGTSQSIGFTVHIAKSVADLKDLLMRDGSELIMTMIQKFQPSDIEALKADMDDAEESPEEKEIFPVLNTSPNILVMIDEAHRSQYKVLGASLKKALPNATRLAFTGTPIDPTTQTFGELIDLYTMKDSVDDGVTREIIYEGRTQKADVFNKEEADKEFLDVFAEDELTESMIRQLGLANRDAYLESLPVIEAKAKDMVNHYANYIFKNGFKAQVVATSRLACIRYKKAIDKALAEKLEELKSYNPYNVDITQFGKIHTEVIISGRHKDTKDYTEFSNKTEHARAINDFKLSYGSHEEGDSETEVGNTGMLIVNNMLLTGFDAPIIQIMYLDRVIRNHNLLQAIARVNRVADDKECGYVIDYAGLGHHIREALDDFNDKAEIMSQITDSFRDYTTDIDNLKQAHKELLDLLTEIGVEDRNDINAYYDLFYDEEIRFQYLEAFHKFAAYLDRVYPNPASLEYVPDFKAFSLINEKAKDHTRDNRFDRKRITRKLRDIADKYLEDKGVTTRIEPISILDEGFEKKQDLGNSKKTKAKGILHAVNHEITVNMDEDPEFYQRYSEMIAEILAAEDLHWDIVYEKLRELIDKMRKERESEKTYGLNRVKQMPFFRILLKTLVEGDKPTDDEIAVLVNSTQLLTELIKTEIRSAEFWSSKVKPISLRGKMAKLILSKEFRQNDKREDVFRQRLIYAKHKELITSFMELAYSLRRKL